MKADNDYLDTLSEKIDSLAAPERYGFDCSKQLKIMELRLLLDIAQSLRGIRREQVKQKPAVVNNYSVSAGDRPEENFKDPT